MKKRIAAVCMALVLLGSTTTYGEIIGSEETELQTEVSEEEETLLPDEEADTGEENSASEPEMLESEEVPEEIPVMPDDAEELLYSDDEEELLLSEEELLTSGEEEELLTDDAEVFSVSASSISNYMHDPVGRAVYHSASTTTTTESGSGLVKKNGSVQVIVNGKKYVDGSFRYNGKYYYAEEDGTLISGWAKFLRAGKSEGSILDSDYVFRYYDPSTYELLYGLQTIDGIPHYFTDTGTMLVNRTVTIDDAFYYADEYGICSQVKLYYGNILNSEADQNNDAYLARNLVRAVDSDTFAGQDGAYSFRAKWYPDQTTMETFGFTPTDQGNYLYGTLIDDSLKGGIGAVYRNVGSYKGREVDLVITIQDWEYFTLGNEHEVGYFVLMKNNIGLCMANLKNITAEMKFYDHESGEEITIKGYATFSDIDISQSLSILSPVDEVYVDESCVLYKDPDSLSFTAPFELNRVGSRITDPDKSNWVQVNYNASTLTFRFGASYDHYRFVYDNSPVMISGSYVWTKDYSGSPEEYNVIRDNGGIVASWQGLYALRLGRVSISPIFKTVSDQDETDVVDNRLTEKEEGFSYTLSHTVPGENESFYYDSYVVTDTLSEDLLLDQDQLSVTDDGDNDRTDRFDVTVTGQTVTFSAKKEYLSQEDFYDNTYKYHIGVKIRDEVHLEEYTKEDYTVPNIGSVCFTRLGEEENANSNEVITRYISPILPTGEITIMKKIPEGQILWAHGNPTFLFSVSGTDADGLAHAYETAVCFQRESYEVTEGYAVLSATIENIPIGTYQINELETLSYNLRNVYAGTDNVTVSGETGTALLTREKTAAAIGFVNNKEDFHNYRHNDYVKNDIPVKID